MATRKKREKEKEERLEMKEHEGRKRGELQIEFSSVNSVALPALSEIASLQP
jgi:hypothetical protein